MAAALGTISGETVQDAAGHEVAVDELLRCVVQTWAEVLRNDEVRGPAVEGFERVRATVADALRRGRAAGTVPAAMDPDRAARVVMGLLHGFLLQRVAFGLTDTAGFADDLHGGLIL